MDSIKRLLATYVKKTISLSALETMIKPYVNTYEEFASIILQFEQENILEMVKSKGRNARYPSLAFQYRMNKSVLSSDYHKELQNYRRRLHPSINLDDYYRKDPSIWEQNLPFIEKIDSFLKQNSFPTDQVPSPERSFELVGDEKWIDENGGKEILERIGLFKLLNILPASDPLMYAINPLKITTNHQYHLIVENKTTYQGLVQVLPETNFSTLIYGRGKAVIASIEQFSIQYPVHASHQFFYFGDIDYEGISIWYSLNQREKVSLALPFYEACLQKEAVKGKEYQKERSEALQTFLSQMKDEHQVQISTLLQNGKYYPQESLKTSELQQIWRESEWTSLT